MKWPKISIVTPSFNQGSYLEKTIRSVLDQDYPNLEYIIIDGGSTDSSVEIIKKYEKSLSYWISERDLGQYHAINKGFQKSSGEIMAWINADDIYCKWTLKTIAKIFSQFREVEWLTSLTPLIFSEDASVVRLYTPPGFNNEAFYEGRYCKSFPNQFLGYIQQESTFWRRSLWEKTGGCLNNKFNLAGDFDLWARFFENSELFGLQVPLAGFRLHTAQKSNDLSGYDRECKSILSRYNKGRFSIARYWAKKLRLNTLPLIGNTVHGILGYRILKIVGNVHDSELKWEVVKNKVLF